MLNEFSRTQLLLGKEAMEKLKNSHIAVFGIGGVGSYAVEALVRSGVGSLSLFDDDSVCLTNINRQLIATHKTVGKKKVEVAKQRILEINPNCTVEAHECFYGAQNADEINLSKYSYIIDAIDTVSSKLILIERAKQRYIPIISCMGTGNKLDPTRLEISDIYKTSVCPLAKVMRYELKKRGVKSLKVLYSKEPPITPIDDDETSENDCPLPHNKETNHAGRRHAPGSVSFVPSTAGLIIAGEVIKDITGINNK